MLYFFLSYARGDDDAFVRKFFDELSKEVRNLTGDPHNYPVGFLDVRGIALGASWSPELINALSTCRVFISLCSPGYFKRPACGREWYVFRSRLQAHEEQTGEQVPALLPLIWTPTEQLPKIVSDLQYHTDWLGEAYKNEGLRQLVRLNRRAVLLLVSRLAKRIVEVANGPYELPAPGPLPAFDELTNPFPAVESRAPQQIPARTRYVHFAVAAPTREQAGAVREDLVYYGENSTAWAPFRPDLPEPLADFARRVATRQRFTSEVGGIDDLLDRIERANDSNQVVVLLVDAWSVLLDRYRGVLHESDRINGPTTAVLVALAESDRETMERRAELSSAVLLALPRNNLRGDALFQPDIENHEDFHRRLQDVLEEAQNRIYRRGRARRLPPGEPPGERPILEGPSRP